ncbi:putative membrane protein [Wickerhamomyces ciferrii]|uniref:Membrane protein n=1 Tax=Wickerhamomyces ciferrii (strain ATCC 14091 / BCRC 22168 / CBS 111 / JCM 3599 / NBRC 0793 / NRRL Y-1031 F-60-10) TaxID=1206466 RepID=K0KIC9_WICCF|nr:uncharacterized protein BN7_1466 [Wickerhamomyces ciferrii]CCH41927.1 putative membrane protein [Wickerhamomyces ciferrii]
MKGITINTISTFTVLCAMMSSVLASDKSTSAKAMPTITQTSASSQTSSYTPTFTPTVPTGSNPNIVIPKLPYGTTFIAFGGVLGLIFFGLMFTRVIYWCLSNKHAKEANQMNKVTEFDYDPSLFQEKGLTKHTSRASIYSLGSTSTLNVLGSQASMEQMVAPSGRSFRTALMNNNPRNSLFISPTELLATQQLNNFQRLEDVGGYAAFESPIDSPYTPNFGHQTTSSIDTDHTREKKSKPARPPSVYMEQLFDDEASIRSDNNQSYTFDAHNRV